MEIHKKMEKTQNIPGVNPLYDTHLGHKYMEIDHFTPKALLVGFKKMGDVLI